MHKVTNEKGSNSAPLKNLDLSDSEPLNAKTHGSEDKTAGNQAKNSKKRGLRAIQDDLKAISRVDLSEIELQELKTLVFEKDSEINLKLGFNRKKWSLAKKFLEAEREQIRAGLIYPENMSKDLFKTCLTQKQIDDLVFYYSDLDNIRKQHLRIADEYYILEPDGLRARKKTELIQDIGEGMIRSIKSLSGFCVEPDNQKFHLIVNGKYNLYNEMKHKPTESPEPFPLIEGLLRHIFTERYELILEYIQVMYLRPKQRLPMIVIASKERDTAKTTFLNFMNWLFEPNSIMIEPEVLKGQFNGSYATKNLITMDEVSFSKETVEKLKALITAKTINRRMMRSEFELLSFFGKIICATNRVTDFAKIETEEVRFWVEEVKSLLKENRVDNFDELVKLEIPAFLNHLAHVMPPLRKPATRLHFEYKEFETKALRVVNKESENWLQKEIVIYLKDMFDSDPEAEEFVFTPLDLKNLFWKHKNDLTVNYIGKVLREDFKLKKTSRDYLPIRGFIDGQIHRDVLKIKRDTYLIERAIIKNLAE